LDGYFSIVPFPHQTLMALVRRQQRMKIIADGYFSDRFAKRLFEPRFW